MKTIVTLGIALSLLVGFAHAEEATSESLEQFQENITICTENLLAIGKAIEAYQKEHGDFPAWLSDLYPKHLAEANPLQHLSEADLLLCPSDKEGGKPIYTPNTDPEMPVSYSYELNPRYREWKTEQRKVYGDAMPIVRCRHHANEDFVALNLSFSSKVYRSANSWEFQISLDTDEQQLRDYLKENEIPWRQVFRGKGWESPVSRQYGIRAIPAPWLIDKDGTLITHQARGEKLERLVAEAVQK